MGWEDMQCHKEDAVVRNHVDASSVRIFDVSTKLVESGTAVSCDQVFHTDDGTVYLSMLECERIQLPVRFSVHNVRFPFIRDQRAIAPLYMRPARCPGLSRMG